MEPIVFGDYVHNAGGATRTKYRLMAHYGFISQGPDTEDAVVFNRMIDQAVRPAKTSELKYLPRGRVFSVNTDGKLIPGVWDTDPVPMAAMLIGSDSDEGDVLGGPIIGTPEFDMDAQIPIKDRANAPFWSLGTGYIYETSEFRPEDVVQLVPTTPLTVLASMDDFDIAGVVVPGTVYVDHIIGTVYEGATPCAVNSSISTIKILGGVVPRITKGTLDLLRD